MYLETCLQQCQHFSLFVTPVDEILDVEAEATLKMIASHLTTKWQQSYSRMCRYVKIRVSMTLVRATHRCIWGSRLPEHRISVQFMQ